MKKTTATSIHITGEDFVEMLKIYGDAKGVDLSNVKHVFARAESSNPRTVSMELMTEVNSEGVGNAADGQ